MKRLFSIFFAILMVAAMAAPAQAASAPVIAGCPPIPNPCPPPPAYWVPTFSIVSVVTDTSVTIRTNNFPANDTFKVLMNTYGTAGIGGVKVGKVSSDGGGVLKFTFNIPAELKGLKRIAIRLQSVTGSGYYAFNWFWNNTTGGSGGVVPPCVYCGYPTFHISAVARNNTVTFVTHNLPKNDHFKVLMGYMGTRAINGIYSGEFDSGAGGSQTFTFSIPAELYGQQKIAIRFQSTTGSGFYAFNWFWNNNAP